MSKKNIAILTVLLAIILDQVLKIYIKTTYALNGGFEVFSWFQIHFVENNGMAMGFEFGGEAGIVAVFAIVYWLIGNIKRKVHNAVIVGIALIFAGAVGNIIDSVFYGIIFDSSSNNVATLFADEPYGTLFHGKVVDMFYFPFIKDAILPEWIPFVGGDTFTFFQYIFNPADAYISVGVALLFIFSKQAFPKEEKEKKEIKG